tara:strand:+ start:60 stop:1055 length:996 start_codon:yes stop_codon:yes gene_type:complete
MDIIAEIGQAHDGSLGLAHSYIDALASTDVKTVKFQIHIADAESSKYEPFRTNFSYQDTSRFDYWKRMEFTPDQWIGLKKHCEDLGLEFLASPFSIEAFKLLEKINVKRYKIGSGEVTNKLLIERIAQTKKPIILSSGMSDYNELDLVVNDLKAKNIDLSILQCTTSYPTSPKNWGLNIIQELKKRYNVKVGFSDHSGEIYSSLFAAAMGAEIFEFHVVFSKLSFGPDSSSSLTINQVSELTRGLNQHNYYKKNLVDKNNLSDFKSLKLIFEKSLSVNKDLEKGHKIRLDDLETKKPSNKGISANMFKEILGKKINKNLKKWDFLNFKDLE